MTNDVVQTDEPTTVAIPGGGRGIVLPSGQLLDPVFASVKSLVRAGEDEYRAVIQWLEHERSERAKKTAKDEAALEETRAQILANAEARAAQFEQIKQETPWKLD
jgi:hypothetical protein